MQSPSMRPGYPPGYYGSPQHPGQLRPGYHHLPPGASNPSFQSMTSHWNLPPTPMSHPGPAYHPHPAPTVPSGNTSSGGGGGGSSKSKYAHLGQYGLNIQQPKAPDKPLLPYMRYSRKMWEELKADGKKVWDVQTVGKIIGQKWREMSEEDKQPYCDEYESEKVVYNEQLKVYKNSPAYKRWQEAKQQAEAARDASLQQQAQQAQQQQQQQQSGSQSQPYHHQHHPPHHHTPDYSSAPHSALPQPTLTPAMMLQQQQQHHDDEEDEYITKKQTAAMRFHRNHRLMLEVFSEAKIPDTRHVVTKSRLLILRKQVQSLQIHQKKLHDDVIKIDKHFDAKKRQFLEDSEKFRRELKRIHDNPPGTWKKPATSLAVLELPEKVSNQKLIKL